MLWSNGLEEVPAHVQRLELLHQRGRYVDVVLQVDGGQTGGAWKKEKGLNVC